MGCRRSSGDASGMSILNVALISLFIGMQGLFQEKDYMNYRFLHKRAFYLAVIAMHVSDPKSQLSVDVCYESKRGDPRLTTLILRPNHGACFPF